MPKTEGRQEDKKYINELYEAVLLLRNISEAKKFLRDLLTEQEIIEFARRWKATKMLNQKESYVNIAKSTSLSSATIARISKWLHRGMGGYQLILKRLNEHHSESASEKK